jgi:hypothetical protein
VEDIQQKAVNSTQPDDTAMEFLNNAQDQFGMAISLCFLREIYWSDATG